MLAVGGPVHLTAPGATTPDPVGALLMLVSGISWGIYTLLGKGVRAPVLSTTRSFVRAAPLAVVGSLAAVSFFRIEPRGLLLAVVSGGVTSGLGYALWYRALRGLTHYPGGHRPARGPGARGRQGGVFLAESITLRLVLPSVAVLGGVWVAMPGRRTQRAVGIGGSFSK